MPLPRNRRSPQRVLTASAVKMDPDEAESKLRRTLSWQKRALDYVDLIPELNYASRFYSRMLKRITIFPAIRGSDDKVDPITEGLPVDLLDRIQDAGGGRSQLQGQYGRLQFITGEGYLFGRDLDQDTERWSFVWSDEIQLDDGAITWKPVPSVEGIKFSPGEAVAYRMWTPHPARSGEADSPMHSILEVAEELYVLTKAVRSTAVSRMVNGLLKVPTELSFGAAEAIGDEDPENNPFLADLIEHITGVIENAGSPEAAAPFIAEAAAEFLAGLEWIPLHDAQTDYMERTLREEAIKRCAYGLDMPPEVLLGLADANHWTGRQITHDMWRSHGAPIAEQLCDDLSEAYLRPALRQEGFPDWQKVVVSYDDADVVVSPDRSEDADAAFDRVGALGETGYRKLKGIPEAMAPDEDERQLQIALKMRQPALLPEKFLPNGQIPEPVRQTGPPADPQDQRDAEEGPPPPGPNGVSRPEARTASARIAGAAEMAIIRCRELAGARIRTRQQANPDFQQLADGHPNSMVASLIGPEALAKMNVPEPMKLVNGGSEGFCSFLIEEGFSEGQAQGLSEMVLVYAAKTLFEPMRPPIPSGFIAQVERAQEVSTVLGPSEREVVRKNEEALKKLNRMLLSGGQ